MRGADGTVRFARWRAAGIASIVASVSISILPSAAASAATLADDETLAVDLDAPGSGSLLRFDPALGTLTRVEISIEADVLVQTCIENLSQEAGSTVGGTVSGDLSVELPTGSNTTTAAVDATVPQTDLPTTNGSDECAAALDDDTGRYEEPVAASDVRFFERTNRDTTVETFTELSDLAPFVGPGSVPFGYTSSSNGDIIQPSEWDIVFVAQGELSVSVTYTYTPSGATTTTAPTATLPPTGSSSGDVVSIAGVVILAGAVAMAVSARRRRPTG